MPKINDFLRLFLNFTICVDVQKVDRQPGVIARPRRALSRLSNRTRLPATSGATVGALVLHIRRGGPWAALGRTRMGNRTPERSDVEMALDTRLA